MLRSHFCFCILCAIFGLALLMALLFLTPQYTQAQQPAAKGPVSFINDVAPILKENCFACHGGKSPKGKFDMTRYESLKKGGTKESPFVPGKPEESLLIDVLTASDKTRMPPKESGDALPPAKVATIQQWIKEGAKLDEGLAANTDLYRELRARRKPPTPAEVYKLAEPITAIAFTPDNQKLVIGGHHELTVWDIATAKLEKRLYTRAERAKAMLFLADGKLVVAGGWPGQEGDVKIYDLDPTSPSPQRKQGPAILDGVNDKTVMVKQLLEADDEVLCLALSPDGKKLAAGGCDRMVHIWDLSAGFASAKEEQAVENHADWITAVTFSPDGKRILTACRDKTVKGWTLAARETAFTFPDHQAPVYGLAVRSDGKSQPIGVSVGEDRQVRFWNPLGNDGKQTRAIPGHTDAVIRVLAHPKQPLVVTCSHDKTIRIWSTDKGALVRTLNGHTDFIFALAMSADGELLASGTYNGEVKVWKIADGSLVKEFNGSPGMQQAATKPVEK